jgi:hypothetical protein
LALRRALARTIELAVSAFVASLVIGETSGGAVGQPVGVEMSFYTSTPMVSFFIFSAPLLGYPFRPKEKTRAIKL